MFFVEAFCFLVFLCFFVRVQASRSHVAAAPVQQPASVQVAPSSDSLRVKTSTASVHTDSLQVKASTASVHTDSLQVKASPAPVQEAICKLEVKDSSALYYEVVKDSVNVDWEEEIPLFHYWRDIKPDEYLFNVPTQEQIEEWKRRCEKENLRESVAREYVQHRFRNMNQYMTVMDFPDQQKEFDDAFVEWRLEQYYTGIRKPDSEYERFMYLKRAINSLCNYGPETTGGIEYRSGLCSRLDLFYNRILRQELMRHSTGRLAAALAEEDLAWEAYHTSLTSTYEVLHSVDDPWYYSAVLACLAEISGEDARIRSNSLEDFYFALVDGADYEMRHGSRRVRHTEMPESRVLQEYGNFINVLDPNEIWSNDNVQLAYQKKVLKDEMSAWQKWMQSRKSVSSLLDGFVKDAYDNATNNALRAKYIMLKNRYMGYGIISNQQWEALIPSDASDEELDGPPFEVRFHSWKTTGL